MPWAVAEAPVLPPPPGTVYAGVGIRFLALILDLIPAVIVAGVLFGPPFNDLMTAIIHALPERPQPGQTSFPELQAAMADAMTATLPGILRGSALIQVFGLIYWLGSWIAFSRTPAMALFGLRIVREEDGQRLSPGRAAVRYGAYLLSALPLLLGFAWALIDSRKQAWHDKLAGTVVVRPIPAIVTRPSPWPAQSGWTTAVPTEPAPAPVADAPVTEAPIEPPDQAGVRKRPSVGGVVEIAWLTYVRQPIDLLASLAIVLIPLMIVFLPVLALYLIVAQDQAVLSFQLMGDVFKASGDGPNSPQLIELNRRALAATAPTVSIGIVAGFLGSIGGSLLIGACAAAIDESRSIRQPGMVTRILAARLPELLALGVAAGLLAAGSVFLLGRPALEAAAGPATYDPGAGLGLVLLLVVTTPVSLYLSAIWGLAVVAVVRENLGLSEAISRAWVLSRGRMRWLVGVAVGTALAGYSVLGPITLVPSGLLAETYIGGGRAPSALTLVLVGVAFLLLLPLWGLVNVEAFRGARDDAGVAASRAI